MAMETAARFAALAHRDLPFVENAWEFCRLAVCRPLDNAMLNLLFWIGANYHHPVDFPDTTGLSWTEGILWYLESILPRSRTSKSASRSLVKWGLWGLGSRPRRLLCHGPLISLLRHGLLDNLLCHGSPSCLFRHGLLVCLIRQGFRNGYHPGGLPSRVGLSWCFSSYPRLSCI